MKEYPFGYADEDFATDLRHTLDLAYHDSILPTLPLAVRGLLLDGEKMHAESDHRHMHKNEDRVAQLATALYESALSKEGGEVEQAALLAMESSSHMQNHYLRIALRAVARTQSAARRSFYAGTYKGADHG